MAILAECPICHRKQRIKNKVCPCGEDLDKAKRAKRVRYWINYQVAGIQKRELVGFSIEDAKAKEREVLVQREYDPQSLIRDHHFESVPIPTANHGPMVYFIQKSHDGPVKIGITNSIHKRIGHLQTASAEPLRLIGYIQSDSPKDIENEIHYELIKHRIRGEWFKASVHLQSFMEKKHGRQSEGETTGVGCVVDLH